MDTLAMPAPARLILWYVDIEGNKGKTTFAQYYNSAYQLSSVIVEPSTKDNMLYNIKSYHEVIFVEIVRACTDLAPVYQFLELVKNGKFTSYKYFPC